MSNLSATAIATRTITVYSSQGKNNNPIQFTGSTWGELKQVLRQNGYNIDEMTAIESLNRHELSLDNASIAEQDFYLHLHPVETKSGAKATPLPTKKALIEEIKAVSEGNEEATAFFKGYSKLSAEELNDQLKKWNKKAAAKAKKAAAPKSATKTPAKKAAAKKATSTDVLATAPVAAITVTARDPQEVQNEYNSTKAELRKAYNGKWSKVR